MTETPTPFLGEPQNLARFEKIGDQWLLYVSASSFKGRDVTRFLEWLEENMPPELRPVALGGEVDK